MEKVSLPTRVKQQLSGISSRQRKGSQMSTEVTTTERGLSTFSPVRLPMVGCCSVCGFCWCCFMVLSAVPDESENFDGRVDLLDPPHLSSACAASLMRVIKCKAMRARTAAAA